MQSPVSTTFITPPPPLCRPTSLSQTLPQGLIHLSVAPAAGSDLVCSFPLGRLCSTVVLCMALFLSSKHCVHLFGLRTRLHKLFKSVEDPAFSVLTPPCWQALTPSTAQGTYSRPTQTSLCHLGLLGKQVGRDRGAMGRSRMLNRVEWLNGDSVHPVPSRGGGRGHPQAKESENLWCLLPSSFWLKTEDSKALEGGGGQPRGGVQVPNQPWRKSTKRLHWSWQEINSFVLVPGLLGSFALASRAALAGTPLLPDHRARLFSHRVMECYI